MSRVETEAREHGRHFDYSVPSALGLRGVVAPFFEMAKPFVKRAATVARIPIGGTRPRFVRRREYARALLTLREIITSPIQD